MLYLFIEPAFLFAENSFVCDSIFYIISSALRHYLQVMFSVSLVQEKFLEVKASEHGEGRLQGMCNVPLSL